jgi:hypothetical protein
VNSRAACFAVLSMLAAAAHADPWLAPGDEGLRADVERLADAGILKGPVTTWPLSWPDVARDALAAPLDSLDSATAAALLRVQRLSRAASSSGFSGLGARVRAAYEPTELRQFADTPREEGEAGLRASLLTNHFALNLQAAYVVTPADGRSFRPDGSYLGVNVGNFMISAGYIERWWGPGWDGSLILSTNARPIPTLTLERNYTDPFKHRPFSWLGRWRASIALGEEEASGVAVTKVRFLAARVSFRPRTWVEFGLSRTAQWCGGDRPCDFGTFKDMLIGRDNQDVNGAPSVEQPGNQMAGYDFRLRSPWRAVPVSIYSQWIGEDEAGGLPSKFIGQLGIETWGSSRFGGWQLHAEYSDTACNFSRNAPTFGCAYRNSIYPQGYTYRGRVIGHAIDNDSRMYSLGAVLTLENGAVASLTARRVELNRDGGDHAISDVPADLDNVELRVARTFGFGRISVGLGYDAADGAGMRSGARGLVTWEQGF